MFREDRAKEREEIIEASLEEFAEALYQFRAILNLRSLAVSCRQIGQIAPMIRGRQPELWLLPRLNPVLSILMDDIEKHIEDAHVKQLMQIFWGISRLGASALNTTSMELMKTIELRLLDAGDFGGNTACNMVEATSNFSFPMPQTTLDFILRDAIYDFDDLETSPYNVVYFLRAVAKSGYMLKSDVIAAAVKNCVFHFDRLTMHHVAWLMASLDALGFQDVYELLHVFRQKLLFGAWASQSMWNDDLPVLSQALSRIQVEHMEVLPIFSTLDVLVRERSPSLDAHQIHQFVQACEKVGHILEAPILALCDTYVKDKD